MEFSKFIFREYWKQLEEKYPILHALYFERANDKDYNQIEPYSSYIK
jgi:hypothetical protein